MDLKTALYPCHLARGGKMVSFAGYTLPVQYEETGLVAEHVAVREKVGIFDVSHMGEVFIEGAGAVSFLQQVCTNDFTKMEAGKVRYTLICYEDGGVVDDLLVYKFNDQKFMLVVNAANRAKDIAWLQSQMTGEVVLRDDSDAFSLIAIQGPASENLLTRIFSSADLPHKYYTFSSKTIYHSGELIISRTGYTGELGYEIYIPNHLAIDLWNDLLEKGTDLGVVPCGLGARDTLRLEAGMPLYGHEMDQSISPLKAGLDFAVKLTKEDFTGKDSLLKDVAPNEVRVGLEIKDRGIAREHENIYKDDQLIGRTTSGTFAPYLKKAIAMGYVSREHSQIGTKVAIEVRKKRLIAEVVALPFYAR